MRCDWIIREGLSGEDWRQALELLFSVYADGGFTSPEAAARLFSRDRLEGNGDLLLACKAEGPAFGAVFLLNDASDLRQVAKLGESEFRLLAVANSARREGIGRELIEECLRRATLTGARRMVLSTQPSMLAAQALYERLGFRRSPQRDWHTAGGGVRWVYVAEILTPKG